MNKCTKYELHLTSECKVIDRCSCCHGNKVSIGTRSFVDSYCPDEQLYQILTSSNFVPHRVPHIGPHGTPGFTTTRDCWRQQPGLELTGLESTLLGNFTKTALTVTVLVC